MHDVNSILLTESFVTASDSLPMNSESLENNSADKEVKKIVTENIENKAEELDEDSEELFPRTQTKEFIELNDFCDKFPGYKTFKLAWLHTPLYLTL